jgi:hypothetical protein
VAGVFHHLVSTGTVRAETSSSSSTRTIWETLEITQAVVGAAAPVREAGSAERFFSQWLSPVGGNKQVLCRARGRDADAKLRHAYEVSSAWRRAVTHLERRLVPKQYAKTQVACGLLDRTP